MKVNLTLTVKSTLDMDDDMQAKILEHYNDNMGPDPEAESFGELTTQDIHDAIREMLEDDINFAEFNLDADDVEIEVVK